MGIDYTKYAIYNITVKTNGIYKNSIGLFLAKWCKEHIWFALPKGVGAVPTFATIINKERKMLKQRVW